MARRLKHLKVFEGRCNFHESVVDRLVSKVGSDSCFNLYLDRAGSQSTDYVKNLLGQVRYKPFFSDRYVVQIYMNRCNKEDAKIIERLLSHDYVQLVVVCKTKKDLDLLSQFGEWVYINNYRPGRELIDRYIKSYLGKDINADALAELISRTAPRYDYLPMHIDKLNSLNQVKITKRLVSIHIPESSKLNVRSLTWSVIQKNRVKDVFSYIEEYRYAGKYLKKNMLKELDRILEFYPSFAEGKLNSKRIKQFSLSVNQSEYIIEKYVELYEEFSYEELYWIRMCLDGVRATHDELTKFIFTMVNRSKLVRKGIELV